MIRVAGTIHRGTPPMLRRINSRIIGPALFARVGGLFGAMPGILFVLWASGADAQQPQPTLSVSGTAWSDSQLHMPSEHDLGGHEIDTVVFEASLSYPMVFDSGNIFVAGAEYRRLNVDVSDWPAYLQARGVHLQRISISALFRTRLRQKWATIFTLAPSVAGSVEGPLLVDAVSVRTTALVSGPIGKGWNFTGGLSYKHSFGEGARLPVLPVLSFDWRGSGRWRAQILVPANLQLTYQAARGAAYGMRASLDGDRYYVPGRFDASEPYIEHLAVFVGPTAELSLGKSASAKVDAGVAYQRYRLYEGSDTIDGAKYDFKIGAFVRVGLGIGF